jgi:hypothetical protein
MVGTRGGHWKFPNDGSTRYVYLAVPRLPHWVAGKFGWRFYTSPDGTAGGNFRIAMRVGGVDPAADELDNDVALHSEEYTVAASTTQYRPTETDDSGTGSTSITADEDLLLLRFGRLSGDGADTATDACLFSGIELTYEPD